MSLTQLVGCPRRRARLRSLAVFAGILLGSGQVAAQDAATACPSGAGDWTRVAGFATNQREAAAAAATTFLPAGSAARIVYDGSLPAQAGGPPRKIDAVRAFMFADVPITAAGRTPPDVPEILSVRPVPADGGPGYAAGFGDGGLLVDLQIPDDPRAMPWQSRTLMVIGCSEGRMASWALIRARISYPVSASLLCTLLVLGCYLLSMGAVYRSSRQPHALREKYPAVFATRELKVFDFLNPIHLTADAFNRASLQKMQVILFSFLVGWLVLSLVLRTGSLTDLSLTVVALLGISGIGAVTAQATYQQRTRLSFDNWTWLNERGVFAKLKDGAQPDGPQWRDLVLTNRAFDVYKLQTIVFSIAVAAAIVTAGGSHLASFTVPQSLLGILGLSQVVYVGGILVRPPAAEDLDQALTKLRKAEDLVLGARELRTDIDPDSPDTAPTLMAAGRLPAGQTEPAVRALRRFRTLARQVAVMIESTLEIAVKPEDLARIDGADAPIAGRPAPVSVPAPAPAPVPPPVPAVGA